MVNLKWTEFNALQHALMDFSFVGIGISCPFHESRGGREMFCRECTRYGAIFEDILRKKFKLKPKHTKTYKKRPQEVSNNYEWGRRIED